MSFITNKQIYYISSNQKISGSQSDFLFKLNNIDKINKFNSVVVLQAVIPKTYYLVRKKNNSFILQENDTMINILMPVGNYSKISFRIVLQKLLNENTLHGFAYSIKDDNTMIGPDTGKFTFFVLNNNDIQPSLIMNSELHQQFGFYENSINTFNNNILISTHFINFNLENKLFIHSNICQNSTGDNILQEIFTTGVPTASFIKYDCLQVEAYSKKFNNNADAYTFYITNENGTILDLNGVDVEFTIMIYEKSIINDEILKYIEIQKAKNYLKLKE